MPPEVEELEGRGGMAMHATPPSRSHSLAPEEEVNPSCERLVPSLLLPVILLLLNALLLPLLPGWIYPRSEGGWGVGVLLVAVYSCFVFFRADGDIAGRVFDRGCRTGKKIKNKRLLYISVNKNESALHVSRQWTPAIGWSWACTKAFERGEEGRGKRKSLYSRYKPVLLPLEIFTQQNENQNQQLLFVRGN